MMRIAMCHGPLHGVHVGDCRQRLLPFGTPAECRQAVRRVAKAFLPRARTGLVGQCFNGKDHREENMRAVFAEWAAVNAEVGNS